VDLPCAVDPDIGVSDQPPADFLESGVQGVGVLGRQSVRVVWEAERGQRVGPDRLPLRSFQQLGSWNHDRPHYRCTFLSEYAAKNKVNHPAAVYVREDQLLPELDAWLSELFSPGALPQTVRELEAAQPEEPRPDEAAQREVAECDAKLRQHRAALEAGADPVLVTSWMSETQARRAVAEARLRKPAGRRRLTRDEITSLVAALGDVMRVLRDADPADKAEVYSRLGLTLTYRPGGKRVIAEVRPNLGVYVSECPRGDCIE
jgi:site-specific DNA recombinase